MYYVVPSRVDLLRDPYFRNLCSPTEMVCKPITIQPDCTELWSGKCGRITVISAILLPIVPVKERASPPSRRGRFAGVRREKSEFAIKASRREIMRDLNTNEAVTPTARLKPPRARRKQKEFRSRDISHRGIIFPSPCHLPFSDIAPRFSEAQREIGTWKEKERERKIGRRGVKGRKGRKREGNIY